MIHTALPSSKRIAVIGAGVSGLACGQRLQRAGHTVDVFDKARGPGGRMSTRRHGAATFDHGAQYFTAQRPPFMEHLRHWRDAGVVRAWSGRFGVIDQAGLRAASPSRPRWVAVPGMSALTQHLCADLTVHWRSPVSALERSSQAWTLAIGGEWLPDTFDLVVISCPGPQAAALLPPASPLQTRASACEYAPCWSAMLEFGAPLELPMDGIRFEDSALSWAARDSSKPGRPPGERWVLHASPEWSERNLERPASEIIEDLLRALRPWTQATPTQARAHRWRYARSRDSSGPAHELDTDRGLGLCGDGLTGARVEDAWFSGHSLAGEVLRWLSLPA